MKVCLFIADSKLSPLFFPSSILFLTLLNFIIMFFVGNFPHGCPLHPFPLPYITFFTFSSFVSTIIKWGLCFVSRYIFAMYCPIIPRQNNWSPPMKRITQMVEAQPSTGSPKAIFRKMITNSM